jgi:ankyrin repeat protein
LDAAEHGDLVSVERLLQQGVNPLSKDELGNSVLDHAARSGNAEVVKKLLSLGIPPSARALKYAAGVSGSPPVIRLLIAAGADLDDKGDYHHISGTHEAPIYVAALFARYDAVKCLIEAGANVNVCSDTGIQASPLHGAASSGSAAVARLLIQHGAIIDARGEDQVTPLMLAAKGNKIEVLRIVLDAGANPFLRDDTRVLTDGSRVNGLTAAMIASRAGNDEAVQVLREYMERDPRGQ